MRAVTNKLDYRADPIGQLYRTREGHTVERSTNFEYTEGPISSKEGAFLTTGGWYYEDGLYCREHREHDTPNRADIVERL